MDLATFLSRLLTRCPEVPRTAWKPEACDSQPATPPRHSVLASKFGGRSPYMPAGRSWPECETCGHRKAFICQLNMSQLPKELVDRLGINDGLFQCFFCIECMPYESVFSDIFFINQSQIGVSPLKFMCASQINRCNIDRSNLPVNLKSYVDSLEQGPALDDSSPKKSKSANSEAFEEVFISRWTPSEKKEIPNAEEIGDMNEVLLKVEATTEDIWGLDLSDLENAHQSDEESVNEDSVGDQVTAASTKISSPQPGVKIGGYVDWVQSVEYPTCPDCQRIMDVTFLQLEDSKVLSFMWGDAGVAHVTLCPECKRPGLGWACH